MEGQVEHTMTRSRVTHTWDVLVVSGLARKLVGEATVGKGRLRCEVVLQLVGRGPPAAPNKLTSSQVLALPSICVDELAT